MTATAATTTATADLAAATSDAMSTTDWRGRCRRSSSATSSSSTRHHGSVVTPPNFVNTFRYQKWLIPLEWEISHFLITSGYCLITSGESPPGKWTTLAPGPLTGRLCQV